MQCVILLLHVAHGICTLARCSSVYCMTLCRFQGNNIKSLFYFFYDQWKHGASILPRRSAVPHKLPRWANTSWRDRCFQNRRSWNTNCTSRFESPWKVSKFQFATILNSSDLALKFFYILFQAYRFWACGGLPLAAATSFFKSFNFFYDF